ncbi:MAG: universal stress protein [Planctomycetes bacterium]|nr:universal stress protein [Planctomycetota bacterium]
MIKRILVALSGTPLTESAVQRALELAAVHGAEITGVTDIDLAKVANVGPVPMGAGAAATELVEHRLQITEQLVTEAIERFESACTKADVPFRVVRETGNPYEKLISLCRYHDLTVAGLRGLFEYGIFHNPDDVLIQLIAKGVRPILAVAKNYRLVRRVLVGYNGSMESAKALKRFVQSRPWSKITLKIVCFDLPPGQAETLLADAASYCRVQGYEAETEHVEGSARQKILEYAGEWQADLLVLGSSSRARLLKHLLGDTTLHAVREADIPLFLTQ